MNFNDYAKVAQKYQPPQTDTVPQSGIGLNGALDVLHHLKGDSAQQQKEPVRVMPPIVPLAN